ncbi:zinc-binding alcohol dehydrogenase family protein [Aquimarina megaterium]|uniref:zinc-binding alcohol dehydrogenase family protein n=1 Tax=Aquimarina megaterium TaxID=1443666 RepID=UPI000942C028|nr:zinc-binding alcohol dehydrogenase family protein [Aquimarina megaterium]
MKAIGIKTSLPISEENSLIQFETEQPVPKGHDLLIKIKVVGINPVDYKVRQNSVQNQELDSPKILGWDAVGIVEAVGDKVTLFKTGDEVFYAGDITRPGSNAEYQLVDERIVGKKPNTISDAEAAVMPLTSLTAWEVLFDRLKLTPGEGKGKTILIISGAGGVGSIATQLAKKLTNLTVIATASRPESRLWCQNMGADHVVNHHNLIEEVHALGINTVNYILNFSGTSDHWENIIELIDPQGHICTIAESLDNHINIGSFKSKSITLSYELMYTRSMYQTEDMIEQHHILNKIAALLDNNKIKSTLNSTLDGFTTENFKEAHQKLESGKTIGKIAITF